MSKRGVWFRISEADEAKLERMRRRSRRPSIQNVLQALVALADETAPEWNIAKDADDAIHDPSHQGQDRPR